MRKASCGRPWQAEIKASDAETLADVVRCLNSNAEALACGVSVDRDVARAGERTQQHSGRACRGARGDGRRTGRRLTVRYIYRNERTDQHTYYTWMADEWLDAGDEVKRADSTVEKINPAAAEWQD